MTTESPLGGDGYLTGTWDIGPASSLEFSVRHMVVSRTRGRFTVFSAVLVTAADPRDSRVEAVIDTTSFDSNDAGRDEATKGRDWIDAVGFPTATYRSTTIGPGPGGHVLVTGELTLRGVTQPVVLDVELGGFVTLPSGRTIAGFSARADIDRHAFGIGSEVLAGKAVGDKISIDVEVEAVLRQG